MANILNLISEGHSININACDGSKIIPHGENAFEGLISRKSVNKSKQATQETAVQVYELVKDATSQKMFNFLSDDLDKLCFTQHQIRKFCKKHRGWLSKDALTFFLTNVGGKHFVIGLLVDEDDFGGYVGHLGNEKVWSGSGSYRVVSPIFKKK